MSWAATVPTVVTKLNTLLTAALAPTRVLVWSHVDAGGQLEAVTIAFQTADEPVVGEGSFAAEGFAASPDRETYVIRCMAAVRDGSNDLNAAALRSFALVALVGGALAGDHTLTSSVLNARLGSWSLSATQDSEGALAELAFEIAVDAFTAT